MYINLPANMALSLTICGDIDTHTGGYDPAVALTLDDCTTCLAINNDAPAALMTAVTADCPTEQSIVYLESSSSARDLQILVSGTFGGNDGKFDAYARCGRSLCLRECVSVG
jgi:hypothetical protein